LTKAGYAVLLRSNGEIAYPEFEVGFEDLRKHVKYQWFEIIKRGKTGLEGTEMVKVAILGDEEGLMNTPSEVNHLASDICGQTIVGDVFIVGLGDYDLEGLSSEEVSTIRASIIHTIANGPTGGS
jgi:hypothetical protein